MGLSAFIRNLVEPAAKTPLHPLLAHNHRQFPRQAKYHGLISDYEFVVFDTELTGLASKRDEIVAIGAVRIRGLHIICGEIFYAMVRPDQRFQTQSTLVHRLTPHELNQAAGMDEVLPRFIEFCGDAFLVGHFVRLDLDFINRATRKSMGGILQTPFLDTMLLAMAYYDLRHGSFYDHCNRPGVYSLTALAKEYGLPRCVDHNALQDSLQTAYLFIYLIKQMQGHGLRTLNDFLLAGRNRSTL